MTSFEQPALHATLLAALDSELDELPFGVVELGTDLICTRYNAAESRISGLGPERVIGRTFFDTVAPCMNNYLVRDRLASSEPLDDIIDYVLSVKLNPQRVRLRLLAGGADERRFLCVEPVG